MSESEGDPTKPESARKSPMSLSQLSQIKVIKMVHQYATKLESDYMEKWLESELTITNKDFEEKLNIRKPEIDTEAVVMKYKSLEADLIRKYRLELQQRLQEEASSKGGGRKMKRKRAKRTERVPYKLSLKKNLKLEEMNEEQIIQSIKPKIIRGIPVGVKVEDYIEYRKCQYIEDIKQVRSYLEKNLNPAALRDLMDTMYNIALYNNKHEHGLLTLQAMLMTSKSDKFKIAASNFYSNFATVNQFHMEEQMSKIETRIGTTILHYSLMDGQMLTHLDLEKCCCDSVLKLVSETSPNLKYLNVSGSNVSDQGLFYLCGVEKSDSRSRPRLSRACKDEPPPVEKFVKNEMPRWKQRKIGCRKLVCFQGKILDQLEWDVNSSFNYYDHSTVPLDAGFVAMLIFLPKLRVFITDVGGRAIAAWQKVIRKYSKYPKTLNLLAVSETHLSPQIMAVINNVCPKIKHFRVEWQNFFSQQDYSREDWIKKLSDSKALCELRTCDIDFKSSRLSKVLPVIGCQLTVISFREIWKFKYSNFALIKEFCPNLVVFCVSMSSTNVVNTINHIAVDKDHNLQLYDDEKSFFKHLEEFHLCGPFGNDLVRYLVKSADLLKCLTLSIEWLDPAFCDNQPLDRKDLLGVEYLSQILNVNPMSHLEEIHLMAQYRRGRSRLLRECAEMILEKFPLIRHIGNFQYWNMTSEDVKVIMAIVRSTNRDIVFEEDLFCVGSENAKFEYKYIPNRGCLSCHNIVIKKEDTNIFANFFDTLALPPDLMDDDDEDLAEADDNLNEDDDLAEDLEDVDDILADVGVDGMDEGHSDDEGPDAGAVFFGGLNPVVWPDENCVIM